MVSAYEYLFAFMYSLTAILNTILTMDSTVRDDNNAVKEALKNVADKKSLPYNS